MLLTDSMIFSLNEEEIGVDGNICPGKMLHLFQDIAGKHAEKFGMGFDDLIENNLIWVVTRIRFCTSRTSLKSLLCEKRRTTSGIPPIK